MVAPLSLAELLLVQRYAPRNEVAVMPFKEPRPDLPDPPCVYEREHAHCRPGFREFYVYLDHGGPAAELTIRSELLCDDDLSYLWNLLERRGVRRLKLVR